VSIPAIRPGCEPFRFDRGPIGIVMVHGFTGSPASMRPMGTWFAGQDLSVIGVRLPGHGTNVEDLRPRSWTEWYSEVDGALTELRVRCSTAVVLGQSMAASLAVHLAASRPEAVDGLVLPSPYLYDPRHALIPVGRWFVRTLKGFNDGDIKKRGQDELAYDRLPVSGIVTMAALMKLARADLSRVRAPALVFEPGNDHTIPASNPRRVVEALGSARKELIRCPDSYHVITLDNDAPMVRERVLTFARGLAPPAA
jgi:carboxylesterase